MIKRLFCWHKNVRCVHYNERADMYYRIKAGKVVVFCMDCETYLVRKNYPELCFLTKKEH